MKVKSYLILLFIIISPTIIYAQKEPNLQEISLRAPRNINIDGKATEWDDRFQAYNHATDVFYTICNDDNNLYLIVQSTEHTNINKILGGGVTLTINRSGRKNKEGISITYPVLDFHNRVWVNLKDLPTSAREADSIMNITNLNFANRSKLISVIGIKDVDTLISIYNHDGIKAAATFNNKLFFTYELSVSLKQLGFSTDNPVKFAYNIKLPGVDMVAVYKAAGQATTLAAGEYVIPNGALPGVSEEYIKNNQPSLPYKVNVNSFRNSTDFWGEYTLARK